MKYIDIGKCSNLTDKTTFLNKFYEYIEIENWLNIDKLQVIRFNDRKEFKKNGKFHNILGPAIEPLNNSNIIIEYYIDGVKYKDKDAWQPVATRAQRAKKLNSI